MRTLKSREIKEWIQGLTPSQCDECGYSLSSALFLAGSGAASIVKHTDISTGSMVNKNYVQPHVQVLPPNEPCLKHESMFGTSWHLRYQQSLVYSSSCGLLRNLISGGKKNQYLKETSFKNVQTTLSHLANLHILVSHLRVCFLVQGQLVLQGLPSHSLLSSLEPWYKSSSPLPCLQHFHWPSRFFKPPAQSLIVIPISSPS